MIKWINSLEKSTNSKKQAKKRKQFIAKYKDLFVELNVKPFATRKES